VPRSGGARRCDDAGEGDRPYLCPLRILRKRTAERISESLKETPALRIKQRGQRELVDLKLRFRNRDLCFPQWFAAIHATAARLQCQISRSSEVVRVCWAVAHEIPRRANPGSFRSAGAVEPVGTDQPALANPAIRVFSPRTYKNTATSSNMRRRLRQYPIERPVRRLKSAVP
jgi:hypothetical protein